MKAMIIRGKNRGDVVDIIQWCNDWFHVQHADPEVRKTIFSPTALAFPQAELDEIVKHKNNGMLFALFEPVITKRDYGRYLYTFKRRNFKSQVQTEDALRKVSRDAHRTPAE